jgi:hypothetical protein
LYKNLDSWEAEHSKFKKESLGRKSNKIILGKALLGNAKTCLTQGIFLELQAKVKLS